MAGQRVTWNTPGTTRVLFRSLATSVADVAAKHFGKEGDSSMPKEDKQYDEIRTKGMKLLDMRRELRDLASSSLAAP